MRPVTDRRCYAGFTLVEMIVSIVVAGVLVSLVSMFGRWQIQSYFDVSSRAALADAADTALRRMAREIQGALPNSLRVDASGRYLEFIPIKDAGRYRADLSGTSGFALDFGVSATATKFDVLGQGVAISSTAPVDQIVIYNLGLSGSDAYEATPTNRRTVTTYGTGLSQVGAAAALSFALASPANRFHVVGNPVRYECDLTTHQIRRRWNYGFQSALNTSLASGQTAVLVDTVSNCSFTYTPGVLQRNGLLSALLELSNNNETVRLLHQVEVLNTP